MKAEVGPYEVVASLILDRSLCVSCIAARVLVGVDAAGKMLDTIASALVLHREAGRCEACGETRIVHFVARQVA